VDRCIEENAAAELVEGLLPPAEAELIEAHVDHCSRCAELLATCVRVETGPRSPGDRPWLARGDLVGRYVVLEWLGAGGMGEVYAADDPELRRRIALKLVRGACTSRDRARLIREARSMARLSHPNVVAVHDAGIVHDRAFIAMELVEGPTLAAWLEGDRSWSEVAGVFCQAGRGLAAAHAAGIVHRDFKPANVLLRDDGRAQVTDFGLAREADAEGGAAGTPAYMAPEQHRGEPAGAGSDQYSFCVALAEALCGTRPPPLPARIPAPRRVRRVLERGLAEVPERRHESMLALVTALEKQPPRALALGAAAAVVAAALAFFTAWHTRTAGPTPAALCEAAGDERRASLWTDADRDQIREAFAAATPDAGTTWTALDQVVTEHADRIAHAHAASCAATRVRQAQSEGLHGLRVRCLDHRAGELQAFTEVLTHADGAVVSNALAAAYSLTPANACDAARVGAASGDGVPGDDQARAEVWRGRALAESGKLAEAAAIIEPVIARIDEYSPGLAARAFKEQARVRSQLGQFDAAEELLHRGLLAAQEAGNDRQAGAVAIDLAGVLGVGGSRYAEAERWLAYARATVQRLGGDPDLAFDVAALSGSIARTRGDATAAVAHFREALALRQARALPTDPGLGEAWTSLGTVLDDTGDREGAAAAHRRGLAILERALGPDHPRVEMAVKNLAVAEAGLGNYQAAHALCERSLAMNVRATGADSVHTAHSLNNLAHVELELGRAQAAREHAERAGAIYRAELGDDHFYRAYAETNLAGAALALGDLDTAKRAAGTAVAIRERALGLEHPELARALAVRARIELAAGDRNAGQDDYERALAIFVAALGADHPDAVELRAEAGIAGVELAMEGP
jgi:eukaryotic-like serine/threonine-protein kinase